MLNFFKKKYPRICEFQVKDERIRLSLSSKIEEYRGKTWETKEPETLEWINNYVKDGDVFYDIGANIGIFTLYLASKLRDRCKIFAFEPDSKNFASLNENVIINNFSSFVFPVGIALCDSTKLSQFHLKSVDFFSGKETSNSQSYEAGTAQSQFGDKSEFNPFHSYYCMGMTLDYMIENRFLPFPNHIKLDVDGLELAILKCGQLILDNSELKSILIEITEDQQPFLDLLLPKGFKRVDLSSYNVLFVRS